MLESKLGVGAPLTYFNLNFLRWGCLSKNFNGNGHVSGPFQTLSGTIQKHICRQHFNQFNVKGNNYTDMNDINYVQV